MPLRPPALDDRGFDDLVEEMLARIPAHTPEWTNPRLGDPGRTIIELFAWLTDTLLYRANLIPERQRLAFLRLLGVPMRPAIPARGLVTLAIDDPKVTQCIGIQARARIDKPVPFETRAEMTVLPIAAEAYFKRRLRPDEESRFAAIVPELRRLYDIRGQATPYVTTPVFVNGAPEEDGFDLIARAVDRTLWLALLTLDEDPLPGTVAAVRAALPDAPAGATPEALDSPAVVLTCDEAKGLEFDAVIVVDPAGILGESPRGGQDLYVAITRATRRLTVVHHGDLPPMLSRLTPADGAR